MKQKSLLFILVLIMALPVLSQDRITGLNFATRSEVIAQNGMAATSHPLATQVALDILRHSPLALVCPGGPGHTKARGECLGCGIGGDLFAILWDAESHGRRLQAGDTIYRRMVEQQLQVIS